MALSWRKSNVWKCFFAPTRPFLTRWFQLRLGASAGSLQLQLSACVGLLFAKPSFSLPKASCCLLQSLLLLCWLWFPEPWWRCSSSDLLRDVCSTSLRNRMQSQPLRAGTLLLLFSTFIMSSYVKRKVTKHNFVLHKPFVSCSFCSSIMNHWSWFSTTWCICGSSAL